MFRPVVLLVLLVTAPPLAAQVISRVGLTEVKQRTADPTSPYLPARLRQADTTLRREDYQ